MNFRELNKFEREMSQRRADLSRRERELEKLSNEVELMRQERMEKEAAATILQKNAPEAEPPKPTGGKWFGTGDRSPSPEEMTSKNLPEILREFDQLLKEAK